jgi:hypothetical protein
MVNVLTCVSFPEGKEGAPLFGGVHCIHRLSTGSCSPSPHKNTAPRSAHRHLRYNPSHMPVGLALLDPRKRPCNPIIFSGICVDDCLSVKPGSVTGALQHLHSVICIPQPPRPLPPYLSTEVNPNSPEVVVFGRGGKIGFVTDLAHAIFLSPERSGEVGWPFIIDPLSVPKAFRWVKRCRLEFGLNCPRARWVTLQFRYVYAATVG